MTNAQRVFFLLLVAGRSEAQLDPSGSWRTLHTPHFRIHFRPAYRDVALTEAREAERAYGLLASELHPPRGKVDLTLADDGDVANGLTGVFPSPRIDLFLTPPATDPGLQLYDSWLRVVTTHELTHVFHLDRARSFWGLAQRVFGRVPGLFPNEYQPSWVTEGLATYYESKFTNGGRVRGSFHTQILAADYAGGASRRPADALLYTRWADGLVPYAYGSRFFHYFAGVAGDSVVPRFVEATAGQLIPYRVGRQIGRAAPGRSLAAEWPPATRPAPAPGAAVPPPVRVIDSLLRTEPVPQVSPDGRRVAYVWDDGKGARELRVLDAASFRLVAAHAVNAGASYDWLGDTVIVAQLDFTTRWRVRSDLYRWIPGGAWRRETHGARVVAPRAGGGRLSTIILGPATNRPGLPVPPSPSPPGATWGEVVPSPDGREVAATRNAGGHWQLMRWPADTPAAAVVLVESRGVITDPTWAASELWFVADPTGLPQVYRWRASGRGGAEPVTAEPLGARAPAALGDGTLLYAALTARGWELRRAPALAGAAPAAFPAPLPFEPAPAVPVRETGYALWPSLRPHFWVPFFLDARSAGRFFGAVTAGSDALGRFTYAGDLQVARRPFRAAGDFVLVSQAFGNPTLDLWGSSSWSEVAPPAGAPTLAIAELDQDAALGASFVTRRWRTAASVRLAAEFERTQFATTPDTSLAAVCPGCDPQDLIGGSVTLALSRLVAGVLSVSPENGFTWSTTYRWREEQGGARWSNEVRSRLGLYARVPGLGGGSFAHHVLAVRLAAGVTGGPLGNRLKIGGVSSTIVGLTFGQSLGGTRAFPVRGYDYGVLRGTRAATGSVEYRLPLALVGRSAGDLPFGADKVWLNAFADAGDAWDRGAAPRLTRLRSTGIELAGNLAVNYDLLLQVRLGVAQPLATPPSGDPRRPRVYVALASDF